MFNKITKGGLPKKTLNICLAGTGVGKSLFMCHQAAAALSINKNVLYVTLEMAEERIAERIDANLLDIPISQLEELSRDMYQKKIDKINAKTKGKIIIKEYLNASNFFLENSQTKYLNAILEKISKKIRISNA